MKTNTKTKLSEGQINALQNAAQLAEFELGRIEEDKFMNYKHEAGVIVSENNTALAQIKGEVGLVEFPGDLIWDLHKARPGHILKLAHSHPPKMDLPSGRDLQTLKTWTWAMHPFPARLSVITIWKRNQFIEKTYLGTLQSKEDWIQQGKGERVYKSVLETVEYFDPTLLDRGDPANAWLLWIIEESYGQKHQRFN